MPFEPKELAQARELLAKFEKHIHGVEGIPFLSEGLSLLSVLRAAEGPNKLGEIASNIALVYLRKAHREIEVLMAQEPQVHWEIVTHWQQVFEQFESSGFALPAEVAATLSNFLAQKVQREIALMSPNERERLREKLEEMDKK